MYRLTMTFLAAKIKGETMGAFIRIVLLAAVVVAVGFIVKPDRAAIDPNFDSKGYQPENWYGSVYKAVQKNDFPMSHNGHKLKITSVLIEHNGMSKVTTTVRLCENEVTESVEAPSTNIHGIYFQAVKNAMEKLGNIRSCSM